MKRIDFEIPHGWLTDTTLQKYIEIAQIHSGTELWLTKLLHLYLKGINEERSLEMLAKMYYNRGCTLGYLGNHEEAINNYEMAVEVKPDWESFFNMSISYSQLGRWREALECCEKARDFPGSKKSKRDLNSIDKQIRTCKSRMKKNEEERIPEESKGA